MHDSHGRSDQVCTGEGRAAIRKGVLKKVMFPLKLRKEEGFNEWVEKGRNGSGEHLKQRKLVLWPWDSEY